MFIIVLLCFAWSSALSQSCLPEGITFNSQAQIDSFQINYPNCTEIEGDVEVFDDEIQNLQGLNVLTSIGGSLRFMWCDELKNLSGLENLSTIGSYLDLEGNEGLLSLDGLNNLNSIGGGLFISWNDSLADITALNSLIDVGGWIEIYNNEGLLSLAGLDNVTSSSITRLNIMFNPSLMDCSIQSICNYLSNPGGQVNIYENASGCNNPTEIAQGCGIMLSCLPYGNYFLRTQKEVDSFFVNYPNCYDLQGFLSIWGDGIINLQGLSDLNSTERHLSFYHCNSLNDFSGLNNLDSIGEMFTVGYWVGNGNNSLINFSGLDNSRYVGEAFGVYFNESLIDFSGLNSLQSVGHFSIIGNESLISFSGLEDLDSIKNNGLSIRVNDLLTNLSGLENLEYIKSYIDIGYNDGLTSLSGIDNLESNSIEFLNIYNNPQLSTCEVQVVCEYLADSNSFTEIHDNAPGCNSREEVEDACESISVNEQVYNAHLSLFPNPAHQSINISLQGFVINELNIYTLTGQRVLQERPVHGSIDISALQAGMYIDEVVVKNSCIRQKLLVQR